MARNENTKMIAMRDSKCTISAAVEVLVNLILSHTAC